MCPLQSVYVLKRALLSVLIGIFLGIILILLIARVQQQAFLLDWILVLFAPCIAILITFVAIWLPSKIATRIVPALAVRLKN